MVTEAGAVAVCQKATAPGRSICHEGLFSAQRALLIASCGEVKENDWGCLL